MPLLYHTPKELAVIILLFLVALIGLIRIIKQIRTLNQKIYFAGDFFEKLKEYVESQGENIEAYNWLIHRSPKMQTNLGGIGIARSYKPPYANYMIRNYQIITNTLPELRRTLEDTLFTRQAYYHFTFLQETILRYIGMIDDLLEIQRSYLKNPIVWLREGVQLILLVPLALLEWIGLIPSATVSKFSGNFIFKIVAGIVTIIGLLSSTITIILGWEQFVHIVKAMLKLITV